MMSSIKPVCCIPRRSKFPKTQAVSELASGGACRQLVAVLMLGIVNQSMV